MPLFSVIIPTFNRARYLTRAIDSVVKQSFIGWELIVVDDCSTDETDFILEQFRNNARISIVRNSHNLERSKSRNIGIDLAKGQFICFLDSDDELKPSHLAALYASIVSNSFPLRVFYTNVVKITDGIPVDQVTVFEDAEKSASIIKSNIPLHTLCFHREILTWIRFPEDISINEDVWFLAKIAEKYTFTKVTSFSAIWNIHEGNTTHTFSDHLERQILACEYMLLDEAIRTELTHKRLKARISDLYLSIVYNESRKGNYGKALAFTLKGSIRTPSISFFRKSVAHIIYSTKFGKQVLVRRRKNALA